MYLMFGLLIGLVWLAIAMLLHRHVRRNGAEPAPLLDMIFIWPIVFRQFKENKTAGAGWRISVMLLVLIVGYTVLIQFGTKW